MNVAMLAALPLAMYAQEGSEAPPTMQRPPSGEMQRPPNDMQQPPGGFTGRGQDGVQGQQDGSRDRQGSVGDDQDGRQGGPQGPQCQIERTKKQIMSALRQFSRIKARVAQLEKKGVKAPQELTDAIAKVDEMSQKVQAIESCEEFADLGFGDAMQDVSSTIQEKLGVMERLANLANVYKNIDRRLKNFDQQLASDKALAAKSKIDLSAAVKNFEDELDQLKRAYADAKAKIDSGEDLEAGFDALQNDVFEAAGNVAQAHAAVQQLRKLSATLSSISREIANDQRALDRLKKAGKDTSEAQQILDEGKAKSDELKAAASIQPVDTSSLSDLLDEMADIRERFTQALNELSGIHEEDVIDQGISRPTFQIPNLDLGSMGGGR